MEIWENLSLEDMEGEVWKDIKGYESLYQISNMGRVKSIERVQPHNHSKNGYKRIVVKILKQSLRRGYLKVNLYRNKKRKDVTVHRVVAEMFISNLENKPTVDHISTIKTDNRVCNLRWATQREQLNDNKITRVRRLEAQKKATNSLKKRVRCITTNEEFESIADGARKYKIDGKSIINCCKGRQEYTGRLTRQKLQWEYID